MCSKHTISPKRRKPRKYPQRRKLFSQDTIKKLNKILYCQNRLDKNRKCNKYIPPGSPERQKHHIIPLSRGGTNNFRNILVCCIDCHYRLHQAEFEARGLTLEEFRARIYAQHQRTMQGGIHHFIQCRKARVGVLSY
ncbi:MAG: HNH endonuclease [Candidatus Helarchaeota archaeon]